MSDLILPKPRGRARGRPFEKGRSGNPGGRRRGSRNKATLAAAALLAGVVDTFVRAIETTKKDGSRFNLLQILTAGDDDEENSEDDSDGGDYEETGEYEETDDRDS